MCRRTELGESDGTNGGKLGTRSPPFGFIDTGRMVI